MEKIKVFGVIVFSMVVVGCATNSEIGNLKDPSSANSSSNTEVSKTKLTVLQEKAIELNKQQKHKEARPLFEELAKQGDELGLILSSTYNRYGLGGPVDRKKSLKYLERAEKQGSSIAIYEIGLAYQNGYGVAKNDEKAEVG